jgi:hypothetical protein
MLMRPENSTSAPVLGWRAGEAVTTLSQSCKLLIWNNFFLPKE